MNDFDETPLICIYATITVILCLYLYIVVTL